jgi:hypothetical protein
MTFSIFPLDKSTHYFHRSVNQALQFLVPEGKSVLYYGQVLPGILPELKALRCVIVSQDIVDESALPTGDGRKCEVVLSAYEAYLPDETFDYIILNGTLGECHDICSLLKNALSACEPSTRLIIYQHNFLWQGIISLAEKLCLIRKGVVQNWVSVRDLSSYLDGMGFQVVRTFRQTICPLRLGFLGPLLNSLTTFIPFLDFFKLNQFIVARPVVTQESATNPVQNLSIVLTVRDERGNIEPIVRSLPQVCAGQEIIFVEGHSRDGTREEIERVIAAYPEKHIRVLVQPGIGQGDAIRVGFAAARGDIIVLYEGDGTSTPEDIHFFYDALSNGRFEFVEGSRFVYPFDNHSMPLLNKIGNILFARWFSWFLGQHTTDVLSGIKAISRKEYETIHAHWGFLGLDDPFGDFELLYGAFRFGLKFCEIPMHYRPRSYGVSKSRVFFHGNYLVRMAIRGFLMFRASSVHKNNIDKGVSAE